MQETTALLNAEAAADWGGAWGPLVPGWYWATDFFLSLQGNHDLMARRRATGSRAMVRTM